MRVFLGLLVALLLCAGGYAAFLFSRDVARAERRVAGRSEVITTSAGRLEYALSGQGRQLLMIHGTGGGFDQGLTFSEKLVRLGYQVIAPSRFGYLRSDFPADPSSERQADGSVCGCPRGCKKNLRR